MTRWLIAGAVIATATSAQAGGLVWHAPSGCPEDPAVRQAIERRLEAPLDSVALAVDVDIAQDDTGFVAHVRVTGTDDRTLTSASCDELTDAVAVVVARLATEARAATPAPPPSPPPIVAPPPAPARRSPWNAGIRITAMVGSGNVPTVGAAGELAGWVGWHDGFVELAGARWLSSTATIDSTTTAGVDVRLSAAALRAGWRFGAVRAWIGGEGGRLNGTGVGLMAPHGGSGTWITAGGGAGVAWRLARHVRGVVGVDVEIAIDRVQFALDSGEVIYRTSLIALRAGAGIELGWR